MNSNPQNSNPFIDDNNEQSIENTVCNVSDGLRLLQLTLSATDEAEITLTTTEQQGISHVIDGMYQALGDVLHGIDLLRRPELMAHHSAKPCSCVTDSDQSADLDRKFLCLYRACSPTQQKAIKTVIETMSGRSE